MSNTNELTSPTPEHNALDVLITLNLIPYGFIKTCTLISGLSTSVWFARVNACGLK